MPSLRSSRAERRPSAAESNERLLLDTHTFLWWDERRLPVAVVRRIQRAAEVYVSAATAWEIAIKSALGASRSDMLGDGDVDLWAVHPGGRTVLDAVEQAFELPDSALLPSRGVLNDYGNMSSGTVMFVLDRIMRQARGGASGCAMSFGPGLVAETMMFRMAA